MRLDVSRSTAVVTGGARGIGLEITRQLVARGAMVIAIGRNLEHLQAVKAEFPAQVTIRAVDLSSRSDVDRLVADLVAEAPKSTFSSTTPAFSTRWTCLRATRQK